MYQGREERRTSGARETRTTPVRAPTLKPHEARTIFAEMVKAEMEAGLLRHSKRRQLVRYAAVIGIAEFEAQLIIAQVRSGGREQQPLHFLTAREVREKLKQAQQYNLTMKKILIATTAAVGLNLLMVRWLFY